MAKLLPIFIFFFYLIICSDIISSKVKFLPDIIIESSGNEFAEYQVKSKIYPASILLNKFILNENPSTKIKIKLNDKIKQPELILDPSNKQILIVTNGYDLNNDFIKKLLVFMLSSEYEFKPSSLERSWLIEGCFSYVSRNINRDSNKDLIFIPYIAASVNNRPQLNKILHFSDINSNALIKNLYQELSEIFISSILTLPDGKILLLEYAHGNLIDSQKVSDKFYSKIKSSTRKNETTSPSINAYLAKIEKEKIPLSQRYYLYFDVIEQTPGLLPKIWPQLNQYLDQEYPAF